MNFPYGIGALASYAWKFEDIRAAYVLKKVFFLREKTDSVLAQVESPCLVGFSCYMWNIEYNKLLARKIKEKYPGCIVLFGGPQIPEDASVLESCSFVDVLIHNEGEVPFLQLLRAVDSGSAWSEIDNLTFRTPGGIVSTPLRTPCEFDFPSPFQSGFFDRLIAEHPDISFTPMIETARGCPHRCAYCSWSPNDAPVRLFPLERVYADLAWVSAHKMEFLGMTDANFGMFTRDEKITDKLIALHETTGYPKKFQVSYAKDSGERVFRISEKLNRVGLCKGVTLSFQTMSEVAQKNIGRSNMDLDYYKDLLQRYMDAGIPTYTELIIGLPGETYESFRDGVEELLEKGQHASLLVHLCEWLPLSGMGRREYLEKYGIGYTEIPLNQPHAEISEADEVREYSRIVTSTKTMPENMWIRTVLFATCVSCFHHLGLLQLPALYLYFEHGVPYVEFFEGLLQFLLQDPDNVFSMIRRQLEDLIANHAAAVFFDSRFGNVAWGLEEYAFLCTVYEKEAFYKKADAFLSRYLPDAAFRQEMLRYQSFIVKTADPCETVFDGEYDWRSYYLSHFLNESDALVRRPVKYVLAQVAAQSDWPTYAREIVWYGRRGGKNIYSEEIREMDTENAVETQK